jgi:hypothetical protein
MKRAVALHAMELVLPAMSKQVESAGIVMALDTFTKLK